MYESDGVKDGKYGDQELIITHIRKLTNSIYTHGWLVKGMIKLSR